MQHTISSLRSMYHFEPLSELALQRYAINPKGEVEFNDDELSSQEVDFVLEVMELYSGLDQFRADRFLTYSMMTMSSNIWKEPTLSMRLHFFQKWSRLSLASKSFFPIIKLRLYWIHFSRITEMNLLEHIDLEEARLFPYARRLAHGTGVRDYSVEDFEQAHTHEVEDSLDKVINIIETDHPEVARSFAYRSFKNLCSSNSESI